MCFDLACCTRSARSKVCKHDLPQVPLAAEQAVELELSSVLRSKQSRNAIDEHLDPPLQQYLTTLHLPTDWQQVALSLLIQSLPLVCCYPLPHDALAVITKTW